MKTKAVVYAVILAMCCFGCERMRKGDAFRGQCEALGYAVAVTTYNEGWRCPIDGVLVEDCSAHDRWHKRHGESR